MDRTTLSAIVSEYALHLQVEKSIGAATRERYVALARSLLALCHQNPAAVFLAPDWTLAQLDRRVVETFLNTLKAERGWKPMSLAYYITSLSAFFRFLKARNHIVRNPCARLRPPLSGEMEAPPAGEAEAVLRMLAQPSDTLDTARRQLALELLYGAALRPAQAFGIAALEVAAETGMVRIRSGETWLELSLSSEGVARAQQYLARRKEVLERDPGSATEPGVASFWLDRRGRPCSPSRLRRQVTRAMQTHGLSGGPATLRVLAARHFAERGADVRSVQNLLKARRLGKVDRFLPQADLKRLTGEFRRAHPRQGVE
jgi:site-specific recombinase XerC